MKINASNNIKDFGSEHKFQLVRVDNTTDYEVVLDVVINRGTLVIKIEKVYD